MRPTAWHPPVELSHGEHIVITRIKRAKLFVFLRYHRHELFDDAFQEELVALYAPSLRGHPPIPPARLALATILQAYTGASDDEVIGATLMDRRWQLVLDCLDAEQAPFSKGTFVTFRKKLTKDRRISVEDAEMRHGRKSRSVRVDGYKRHVLHDLDTGLIRAVGITPANVAEASVTEAISEDLEQQSVCLKELHIDRAYLSSHLVRKRSDELEVYCKAWPVREGKHFSKQAFTLDWERQIIRCPAEQEMPFAPGGVVHFPQEVRTKCPLKAQCTASSKGRSVSIHPDEALLNELRQRQQTPQRRAQLRERVTVEHICPMLAGGKGGERAIVVSARISSTYVAAPPSTICMFWLVPSHFKLSFRTLRDFLTDPPN
jgi:hypothetical protein